MAGADRTTEARELAPAELPRLCAATGELSWLLARGYAEGAAATLVGDHHQLTKLQRMAVRRCACPEDARRARIAARVEPVDRVAVDGFNQLVTVERGLAGGVVLRGRDGALRDVAGVHGSWRRGSTTLAAIDLLLGAGGEQRWVLDAPVSNSGRLAALLRDRGVAVETSDGADHRLLALAAEGYALATSDAGILGRGVRWVGLVERALAGRARIADLGG